MHILAIETSCDETAAAVIEAFRLPLTANRYEEDINIRNSTKADSGQRIAECRILSNVISSQIDIHRKFGGVFPEHASRAHAEKIISVIQESLKPLHPTPSTLIDAVDLIAVTTGPGLIGSLLIGVNAAKTLAYTTGKPIIGINHWLGHIYSNWTHPYSSLSLPIFPCLVLIVSGGHTGLVLMKSHTEIQTLGETLDDAAGEAFDKVAKLLELGYPGGPAISAEAAKFQTTPSTLNPIPLSFPRSMLDRQDYNFSFSGLKTAVLYKVKELTKTYTLNPIRSTLAFEFQQAVIDILIGKTIQAAYEFRPKSICLCGGVSANKELRLQMQKAVAGLPHHPSFHVPSFSLCTDNAAMIGIAASYQNPKNFTSWDKINADANLKLG